MVTDQTMGVVTTKVASRDDISAELDSIWSDILRNPELVSAVGVDLEELGQESPFQARQEAAQEGIAAIFLVAFVGAMAKSAAETLWKELVLPELKRRFGGNASIEDSHDKGPG